MRTPPALIRKVIETHQLDTLAAYDQAGNLRIFYIEAPPDELTEHVQDLVNSLEGTFQLRAWRRAGRPSGRKSAAASPYVWNVTGKKPEPTPIQGPAPAEIPQTLIQELADLRAEKLARERLDAMEEDDEEDEDNGINGTSVDSLVNLLTGLLMKKPAAPITGTTSSGTGLGGERLEAILEAIRNLHQSDPDTFAQYEQALISTYGSKK